jgi:soluble lytic murein transglycosylase-like protein
MKRLIHLIGLLALTVPVWAGEYVVLENGFRLHADRHEIAGNTVQIFSNGGVTEMAASVIAGYEKDGSQQNETTTPPPVPPTPLPALSAPPAASEQTEPPSAPALASLAAKKFALPENFVRSVMKAESGFQPDAVSPKGAIGLMQLMPETARQLGVDPRNPHQNADGGAQYLRDLLARYEGDPNQVLLALAAYNAGPAAVERYHGVPPFRETREYILRVLKNWEREGNK